MIKFEKLTTEEQAYICSQVPLSAARQYFQKNPKPFAEIKPGFRPERLSDADTFSLLSRNINKPFIASFLEKMVSKWLTEIQENRNRLANEGYSEEEALLLTIPESVFCDNCELYFRFIGQNPDGDYIRLFREALSLRQKEAEAKSGVVQPSNEQKFDSLLEEANKTIDVLREQLKESKSVESTLTEELTATQGKLTGVKEELNRLTAALQERNELNTEMQAELEHYRRLASFSDEYVQDEAFEFQHTSIGQIYHDFSGQPWITRLADIIDGEIVPFILDDTAPRYFSNRDRLFWKDGPEDDNMMGVWNWRADPNHSDPTKDYVTSEYSRYSKFTEVVMLPQCKSLSEVAILLTDWFEKGFSGEKVLFICTTASGTYEGLLCSAGSMEIVGQKARLLASVFMLPHYNIKPSDIIRIGGLRVYRKMSLGIPQSIFRVRTPYDVVKKMLLSRVTVSALRENELTKREAQKCKHFLESIPTETLIQDLSDAYACTEAEAKAYIDGFIEHAETYLSENDLDTHIISVALARNEELVSLCKKMLSEDWEKEYSDRIDEARKRLEAAESAEKEERKKTEEMIREKDQLNGELQQIQQKIVDANQLAADVEKKVAERINAAQQNAAEFISQFAFFPSFVNSGTVAEALQGNNSLSVFRSTMDFCDQGTVDDIDTFEEELTDNLETIGYSEEIAVEMAQAVSFCICGRFPIIIGENATAIAQCIAATIGGEELTEVFIGNQHSVINSLYEMIERQKADHPLVYLIHGAFDGYSNTIFNEISSLVKRATVNTVVILSLQGVSPNMITNTVWSSSFFVDGDVGIQRIENKAVHAVNPCMDFVREMDDAEYKTRWKELQPFSPVLSNLQMRLYAKYLACYGVGLKDSPTILNQMIAVCRSSGSEEQLLSLFHENGISSGEKMIELIL